MNKSKRQQLLEMFCNHADDLRPIYQRPFLYKHDNIDYVVATEGHVVLALPATDEDSIYEYVEDKKFSCIFCSIISPHHNYTFEELNTANDEIVRRLASVPRRCDECDGTGTVSFEYHANDDQIYNIDGDCPLCNGSGYTDIERVSCENKYLMPLDDCDEYGINTKRLRCILAVMKVFGKEECTFLCGDKPFNPYHIIEPEFHIVFTPIKYALI